MSGCQRDKPVNDPATNFIALESQPATSPSGRFILSIVVRDSERPYELDFTITRGELLYSSDKTFNNHSVTTFSGTMEIEYGSILAISEPISGNRAIQKPNGSQKPTRTAMCPLLII
ncbi:hypothetical protein OAM69_06225 [bacterium]|nr:hypothetical protein [bacterium]